MLLTEKDGKYAKLVQALCICDGQPMVFNQAEVSQRLLFDEKFFDGLVAPLKKLETNDFVLEMLSLLSSLCMGRNYIAIEKLKDLFTQEDCSKIISNDNEDPRLRKKYLELLIALWVDRSPYSKLVLPDRIRIWEEIDERNEANIPSTQNDFS